MFASNIAPRFAGVYQVIAKKQDGSPDLNHEEQVFSKLKKFDEDEFHKVAENLHDKERQRQKDGQSGAASAYDPTRSFLFTKYKGRLTVFTGMDAQGLMMYCPNVPVCPPGKDPTRLEDLEDQNLVGYVSSRKPKKPADKEESEYLGVQQYLEDLNVQPVSVDYNRFKDINQAKQQREDHEDEMRALRRRHSDRPSMPAPIVTSRHRPTRSYSLTFVAPDSPRRSQPSTPADDSISRSYSDYLLQHALRHASGPNTPQ